MNDLELVNKKKDELEEKIRILTLASEEKQVNVLANLKIIMEKSLIDNCDLYRSLIRLMFYLLFSENNK